MSEVDMNDQMLNSMNNSESVSDDPDERRVLYAALDSFRQYRRAAHYNVTHLRRESLYSLPSAHADILSEAPFSLPQTLRRVDDAIDANAELSEAILAVGLSSLGLDKEDQSLKNKATPSDVDKARSTIRQFYRDWSVEGNPERHACFSPILAALESYLPSSTTDRSQSRVLVPGAGLGRLVFEVCRAGWMVEGNEISYHQLLASNYILNYTQEAGQHTLYPWALAFSNHLTRDNQLRSVKVPDIHPSTALAESVSQHDSGRSVGERMSMSAGDFCVIYRDADYKDYFDAVTTCFFIDTAPNVIHYIETVRSCLRKGGIWINLGPLLWHFESAPTPAEKEQHRHHHSGNVSMSAFERNTGPTGSQHDGIGDPGSFELSNEEVIGLVSRYGFDFLEHKQTPAGATGYIQDPDSMLQNIYKPAFWIARKL